VDEAEETAVEDAKHQFTANWCSSKWERLSINENAPVTMWRTPSGVILITPAPRQKGYVVSFFRNIDGVVGTVFNLALVNKDTGHVAVVRDILTAAALGIARQRDGTSTAVTIHNSKLWWSIPTPFGMTHDEVKRGPGRPRKEEAV
jgi:hypothetical protein